jgi:hypothetical protein
MGAVCRRVNNSGRLIYLDSTVGFCPNGIATGGFAAIPGWFSPDRLAYAAHYNAVAPRTYIREELQ